MEPQNIGFMIKILSETISQRVNRDYKAYNLTMQQMKILHFLKQREGKEESSQKDIQDYMRISHPTTVNILRLMREKGFIQVSTSPKDKRMRMVTLTGQEDSFVKKVIQSRERLERQLVKGLSEKEQEDLRRYLRQMYANITEANEKKERMRDERRKV